MQHSSKLIDVVAKAVGGQRALAKKLGLSPQAVNRWKRSRIPAERVIEIEKITGVARHVLRPDIYPRAENT
jgi:DNA-binding transcriptional regulator YdaS (Cro superfamily)